MFHNIFNYYMTRLTILIILLFSASYLSYGQEIADTLNQVDDGGRKIGYWKKYDDRGMVIYEGRFNADIPVGEFKYYYPDGKTKAIVFFSDNGYKSTSTTFHYSGKTMTEGSYLDKQKDSLWKYFDINGILLKEEFYSNNQKNGSWKAYFDNGQVAEEMNWKDGVEDGPWIQYFTDGQVKMKSNFLNGEKQGAITYYFPSGHTRITGQYENSFKTGTWYYMNDSSKVIKIEEYEAGKLVDEESFETEADSTNQQ